MEIKELREKKEDELLKLLEGARLELVRLRLERKTGSLADGSVICKKRKEMAKILTVLKEKEILEEATEVTGATMGTKAAEKKPATTEAQKGKETQRKVVAKKRRKG